MTRMDPIQHQNPKIKQLEKKVQALQKVRASLLSRIIPMQRVVCVQLNSDKDLKVKMLKVCVRSKNAEQMHVHERESRHLDS